LQYSLENLFVHKSYAATIIIAIPANKLMSIAINVVSSCIISHSSHQVHVLQFLQDN